jgi:hypothetical protein
MKQSLKYLSAAFVFLAISLNLSSCSSDSGKRTESVVPFEVLHKANVFIISKTGLEFFKNYITINFAKSKYIPPYYEVAYNLYIPDKPYVNALITFTIDSSGNVFKDKDIIGIPSCKNNPAQCNWEIDEETAINIAKDNGLAKGIKQWQVKFIWNPERQIYVWYILSTIREFTGDFGYRGTGKEMILDPVSGEVLALNDWNIR